MGGTHLLLAFLYRLSGLALLGLIAVILVGPVVAVVSVLASFAFIGLLFWLPARLLLARKPIDWRIARDRGRALGDMMAARFRGLGRLVPGVDGILERSRQATLFVTAMLREVTCGAALGAMLGSIRAMAGRFEMWPIVVGLCAGAGLGALVAMAAWAVPKGVRPLGSD